MAFIIYGCQICKQYNTIFLLSDALRPSTCDTGIFMKNFFPPSFKKNLIHMKTQKHAMKCCQEHDKPAGNDIFLTVNS